MAYIGNTPAENYASFLTETFTVSATASYTLSHAVSNENDIRLVINGVVQQPGSGKAYTASGTTLTLTSATVSGDSMYAVYLGRALQTVNPPNASVGSAQIADSLISGKTALGATPADTDELLISDAGTLKRVDYSYLKSTNTPTFRAYANSNLSLANNADTTLVFDAENFDSQSTFNTSTGRFTPGVSGKYFLYANIRLSATNDGGIFDIYLKKNSSTQAAGRVRGSGTGNIAIQISDLVESDTDDYFYIQIYQATGGSINATSGSNVTYFTGYKIIE